MGVSLVEVPGGVGRPGKGSHFCRDSRLVMLHNMTGVENKLLFVYSRRASYPAEDTLAI